MGKIYPQLINELELNKAKMGAKILNDELIFFETGIDGISAVLMEVESEDLLHSERFLVTEKVLGEKSLSREGVYNAALNNLRELPFKLEKLLLKNPYNPNEDLSVYQFLGQDGFEAARILLKDELEGFADFRKEGCFYAIPTTDILMVVSGKDAESFGSFAARENYRDGEEFKVSPKLYDF